MAFKIADGYVEVHGSLNEASFREAAKLAGERAGRDTSDHFSTAFTRSMKRDKNKNKSRFLNSFREIFEADEGRMGALLHPLETALSRPIVGIVAAGIVSIGAGAIAAAINSAVLLGIGGVVLGGAAALLADKLKTPFKKAMNTINKTLESAAKPLMGPFKQAMRDIALLLQNQEGQFRAIFQAAAPIVPLLVDVFAEFAKEILPTIGQIMPFIVDMFETLAARSPEIADAITGLLKAMADEDTITAFNYLLTGLIGTIDFLAWALGALTGSFVRDIDTIKEGIHLAGGVIDGLKAAIKSIPRRWNTFYQFMWGGGAKAKLLDAFRAVKKIPLRTWTKYLFQPGAAVTRILQITRLNRIIPRAVRTVYNFLIGGELSDIGKVIGALSRIPRNVTTTITTVTKNIVQSIYQSINPFARASGGIIGAQGMATGGVSGARKVLVGEQGPEMVDLPFGSRVRSAGDTRRELAGAGGGGGQLVIQLRIGDRDLGEVIVDPLRRAVRSRGGDVQAVLGR